jgi:hypothetical protein
VSTVSTLRRLASPGEYESIQSVTLPCSPDTFDSYAQPDRLTRMLHGYFAVAAGSTLRLVRVRWEADGPRFILILPLVTLIAMAEPRYESSADRRAISLAVIGGLLVNPAASGCLAIALERRPPSLIASVELQQYQPRYARNAIIGWLYGRTQARVHAWVGRRFLRQFAMSVCQHGGRQR